MIPFPDKKYQTIYADPTPRNVYDNIIKHIQDNDRVKVA